MTIYEWWPLHIQWVLLLRNPLSGIACVRRDKKGEVSCNRYIVRYQTDMG